MTVLLRVGLVFALLFTSLVGSFLLYRAVQPAPASTAVAALPVPARAPSLPATPAQAARRLRVAPLLAPSATTAASPVATLSPVPPSATIEPSATRIPGPTAFPKLSLASFHAPDGGMRRNIEVAVNANGDALRHVVIAPGATFSFNSALGPRPEALPWRMVGRRASASSQGVSWAVPPVRAWFAAMDVTTPTAVLEAPPVEQPTPVPEAPTDPPVVSTEPPPDTPVPVDSQPTAAPAPPDAQPSAAPPAEQSSAVPVPPEQQPSVIPPGESPSAAPGTPTAVATPEVSFPPVLGGGVCDLASRFVVTGRTLLPPKAFRFKPHPGGLAGLRKSDAVSIWATNSGRYDNDLLITNTTKRWLVYEVYLDADLVTVAAWLQDGP